MKAKHFYHVYPLGYCGCPSINQGILTEEKKLWELLQLIPVMKDLRCDALLLGPIFESRTHGYDTLDYRRIDTRLGMNEDFKGFVRSCHEQGIRVFVDTVFNHVSREHPMFRDLQNKKRDSVYLNWFSGVNFERESPYHDGFDYDNWAGCYELVKLNLRNPEVRRELIEIAKFWTREWDIDGFRMDAADVMDIDFLRYLTEELKRLKPNLEFLGEMVHGDYNRLIGAGMDLVTNYEVYKGLYSSLNDRNYFEIAYSLNREFGINGLYRGESMYNFVDNHDVNRIASTLKEEAMLYPLYMLLYTMPGIPSLYYFSEKGIRGVKGYQTDAPLRPSKVAGDNLISDEKNPLVQAIKRFIEIRSEEIALQRGDYREHHVSAHQLVFSRRFQDEEIVVLLNSDSKEVLVPLKNLTGEYEDLLNRGTTVRLPGHVQLFSSWGAILKRI